jgi:hypothetical protein
MHTGTGKCIICGDTLSNRAKYCKECARLRNLDNVKAYEKRKKNLKKQKGEKNLLRLKAMLEGVDLTPYLPKPGQELEEEQSEAQNE